MIAQAEQLLQRGRSVNRSLPPTIFNIFGQWRLTDDQQMILLPDQDMADQVTITYPKF